MEEHTTGKYKQLEFTRSAAKANLQALYFILPVLLLLLPLYMFLWPDQFTAEGLLQNYRVWGVSLPVLLFGLFIPGAALHELLHGLTWAAFCKNGLKSITYGMHWKLLTPYCHCKEILPFIPYVIGGMMPGLVMGLLPTITAFILGNLPLFIVGLLFTVAAGGDMLVLWMLRHCQHTDLVLDHPDMIGCIVYREV